MNMSWLSFCVFMVIALATNFAFGEESVSGFLQNSSREMQQAQAEYEIAMGRTQVMTSSAPVVENSRAPASSDFAIALHSQENSNTEKH